MELTSKTREEFREYFLLNNGHMSLSDGFLDEFLEFPDSMKYGVYQDYFQSVNIFIGVFPMYNNQGRPYVEDMNKNYPFNDDMKVPEARTAVIQKANALRNEQLKKALTVKKDNSFYCNDEVDSNAVKKNNAFVCKKQCNKCKKELEQ